MRTLIGKIWCFFGKHRRGKFAYKGVVVDGYYLATYACPRCSAEWRRKIKVKPGDNA